MAQVVNLRVGEAIERAKAKGIKVFRKDIAARLWSGSSESTQKVCITNLCSGKTKRVEVEWIKTICEMCDCTPNYLFGYED